MSWAVRPAFVVVCRCTGRLTYTQPLSADPCPSEARLRGPSLFAKWPRSGLWMRNKQPILANVKMMSGLKQKDDTFVSDGGLRYVELAYITVCMAVFV